MLEIQIISLVLSALVLFLITFLLIKKPKSDDFISKELRFIFERQDKLLENGAKELEKATETLEKGLDKLQKDNETKLEQMRQTVDEKLNVSLSERLSKSFEIINKRLQDVYEGLGEMRNLASGVGDLKKVLTNVKTRGTWGEVQLGSLLEQMLAPNQYASNVAIKKGSRERVDYAVIIPVKNEQIYLPIDAKFPLEDYQRLVESSEKGELEQVEIHSKNLEKRIKEEAKNIKEKYIFIPYTTDYAILYLPIEGLYAEVTRKSGLTDELQRKYKVVVCGPTTISAFLNSLQLGFRTLIIEKRSSEIWTLLGTFKREFVLFADLLTKTQKKLTEASNTIEDAAKKTRTIQKKLKAVAESEENLIEEEPAQKLDFENTDEEAAG